MIRFDGGPAFARPAFDAGETHSPSQEGMSLRDYFAGQAMFFAHYTEGVHPLSDLAQVAYEIADAMLAERDRAVQS